MQVQEKGFNSKYMKYFDELKRADYNESEDFTVQEKKSTEKLGEEKPKHDIDSLLDDLKRDTKDEDR